MNHTQILTRQKHGIIFRTCILCKNLCMPAVMMSRHIDRFLADRSRNHCSRLSLHRKPDRINYILKRCFSANCRIFFIIPTARFQIIQVNIFNLPKFSHCLLHGLYFPQDRTYTRKTDSVFERLIIPNYNRNTSFKHRPFCQRFHYNFRPNTGRISHCNCDSFSFHRLWPPQ